MPSPRTRLVALAVVFATSGCANLAMDLAARRESTREIIAQADPAFGGGAAIERQLLAQSGRSASAAPQQREAFLAATRIRADAEALALVHELVPDSLADAIGEFVASPAAASVWAAEASALGWFVYHGDDFFTRTAELFADPKRCGQGAIAQLAELRAMIATGTVSASPSWTAIQVAAQDIHEEQARELAQFQRTPAAAAWLAARNAAFLRSQPRFAAAVAEAREHGFPRRATIMDELPDLILPRAQFATAPTPPPALTFLVDDDGGVRCGDTELPDISRPDELLEALRALREQMLADGSLHLRRLTDDPVDNVVESVMICSPKGTQWPHIGTLMKLLADPRLAFWKVEFACDPTSAPEPARMPR